MKYLIKGYFGGCSTKYGADPQEALLKQGSAAHLSGLGPEEPSQWGTIVDEKEKETRVPTMAGSYMDYYESLIGHYARELLRSCARRRPWTRLHQLNFAYGGQEALGPPPMSLR